MKDLPFPQLIPRASKTIFIPIPLVDHYQLLASELLVAAFLTSRVLSSNIFHTAYSSPSPSHYFIYFTTAHGVGGSSNGNCRRLGRARSLGVSRPLLPLPFRPGDCYEPSWAPDSPSPNTSASIFTIRIIICSPHVRSTRTRWIHLRSVAESEVTSWTRWTCDMWHSHPLLLALRHPDSHW